MKGITELYRIIRIIASKYKLYRKNKLYNDLYLKFKDYTMIPAESFIDNLNLCEKIISVEGNIVECGVWKGGMIAALSILLGENREYYLFDSFEGLPEAQDIDGEMANNWQKNTIGKYYFNNCQADEEFANKAMKIAHASNFKIIKGWFQNTLNSYNSNNGIALLRLDADWYASTLLCLQFFFPNVKENGLIIIDDYYTWDGCSKAVHDYFSSEKLHYKIRSTNKGTAYILKK
jgi:O-methyltransferase